MDVAKRKNRTVDELLIKNFLENAAPASTPMVVVEGVVLQAETDAARLRRLCDAKANLRRW